ncbi:hypothetical protein [Cohnella yongneupensis]|uniref:Uncharacterized protein n=1 Tax=Cohnella yongneupensis TaxID=425006 RepID=A0ABW0QV43_9BACL
MAYIQLNIPRHFRYVNQVKDFIQKTIQPEQIIDDRSYLGGLEDIGGELFWFVKNGVTVKYDWMEEWDRNSPNGTHSILTEENTEEAELFVREISEKIIRYFNESKI